MRSKDDVTVEIKQVNVYVHSAAGIDPARVGELVAQKLQEIQDAARTSDEILAGDPEAFEQSDVDGVDEKVSFVPPDPISAGA